MAQLTQADNAELKARGLYAKERCDRAGCKSLITHLRWLGRSHAVFCSRECRDLQEPMMRIKVPLKVREDVSIDNGARKKTVKVKADMVLGIAKPGTTLEKVLSVMLDEKWHTKDSLKKCKNTEKDSIGWRWTLLEQKGGKAERPFKIEIIEDKARLVFLSKNGSIQKVAVQDVPVADV